MMEDFPHNERIPHLARDPVFAETVEDNLGAYDPYLTRGRESA